jgi:hypothetical protein
MGGDAKCGVRRPALGLRVQRGRVVTVTLSWLQTSYCTVWGCAPNENGGFVASADASVPKENPPVLAAGLVSDCVAGEPNESPVSALVGAVVEEPNVNPVDVTAGFSPVGGVTEEVPNVNKLLAEVVFGLLVGGVAIIVIAVQEGGESFLFFFFDRCYMVVVLVLSFDVARASKVLFGPGSYFWLVGVFHRWGVWA